MTSTTWKSWKWISSKKLRGHTRHETCKKLSENFKDRLQQRIAFDNRSLVDFIFETPSKTMGRL